MQRGICKEIPITTTTITLFVIYTLDMHIKKMLFVQRAFINTFVRLIKFKMQIKAENQNSSIVIGEECNIFGDN